MVQLKNQNTHKMAPRGEEENSAILAGTLKKRMRHLCGVCQRSNGGKNRPKIAHIG